MDVSRIDAATGLFGVKWPTPVFLRPCGSHKAFHAEGEPAVARARRCKSWRPASRRRPIWQKLYPTSGWEAGECIVRHADAVG
ncbi:MAG: alpha-hydroxy-acid oxidizing protein [Bryobacteraceae bacterium]